MSDKSFLDWPFFEARHRELAVALEDWCASNLPVAHDDVDAACKGSGRGARKNTGLSNNVVNPVIPGCCFKGEGIDAFLHEGMTSRIDLLFKMGT